MNEFEVQSLVMQARGVKPADKFVMICILKNVDVRLLQESFND
jgi:hypothetical protein